MEQSLQTKVSDETKWTFVTDWVEKNKGLFNRIYNQRGHQTYLTFEDTHNQIVVFVLEEIRKLGEEADSLITAYYTHYENGGKFINECEKLKTFKKKVLGRLTNHLWNNRDRLRVCDVDSTQPDNTDKVVMHDIYEFDGFFDFVQSDNDEYVGKIHDYDLINAMFLFLSARQSEVLGAYLGLNEEMSCSPTMQEVADKVGITVAAVSLAIKKAKERLAEVFQELSITQGMSKKEILAAIAKGAVPSSLEAVGIDIGQIQDHDLLNAMFSFLTLRQTEILSSYLGLNKEMGSSPTMKEIASKLDIPEANVSQIIKTAKDKLTKIFQELSITQDMSEKEILAAINNYEAKKSKKLQESQVLDDFKVLSNNAVLVSIKSIKTAEPFKSQFPIHEPILHTIAKNMRDHGYDKTFPLIIWKEKGVLIDGHTRLEAAKMAGLEKVWAVHVHIVSEKFAIDYMFQLQFRRRNVKDSDLLSMAKRALDRYCKEYDGDNKALFLMRKFVNLNKTKASSIIVVLNRATEEQLNLIYTSQSTINTVYYQVKTDYDKGVSGDADLFISSEEELKTYNKKRDKDGKAAFLKRRIETLSPDRAFKIVTLINKATPEQKELIRTKQASIESIYKQLRDGRKKQRMEFNFSSLEFEPQDIQYRNFRFFIKHRRQVGGEWKVLQIDGVFNDEQLVEKVRAALTEYFSEISQKNLS